MDGAAHVGTDVGERLQAPHEVAHGRVLHAAELVLRAIGLVDGAEASQDCDARSARDGVSRHTLVGAGGPVQRRVTVLVHRLGVAPLAQRLQHQTDVARICRLTQPLRVFIAALALGLGGPLLLRDVAQARARLGHRVLEVAVGVRHRQVPLLWHIRDNSSIPASLPLHVDEVTAAEVGDGLRGGVRAALRNRVLLQGLLAADVVHRVQRRQTSRLCQTLLRQCEAPRHQGC